MEEKKGFGAFVGFDKIVTPSIMKVFFIVGSVVIILRWLSDVISQIFGLMGNFGLMSAVGLIGGLFWALVWVVAALFIFRIICEVIVLFFKNNHNAGISK